MKKVYSFIGKMVHTAVCLTILSTSASALTFRAVLSGDFNSLVTWGGVVPGSLLTVDSIVIPSGITVTLNLNQAFSGSSTLVVNGTLTSGTNSSALIMTSGNLAGNGTIMADSMVLGLTSGFSFSGTVAANSFTSLGVTQASAATVTVNNRLYINSGNLNITSGSLALAANGSIMVNGGTLTVGSAGSLDLSNNYDLVYSGNSTTSGAELSGTGLTDVTVRLNSGSVSLASDMNLNGTLMLTSGNLDLNDRDLVFGNNSDFAASGSGSITANTGSNISITATNDFNGALRFTTGSNTVNDLTLNMGSGSMVSIASDLNVNGTLMLNSGMLNVGSHNLMVTSSGSISGGSPSSYVVTSNGGSLMMNINAGASGTFHVGSMKAYAPAMITANSGSANSNIGLSVGDSVYAQGTAGTDLSASQSVVNATWHITSSVTSGLDLKLQLMWSSNMEVNGFNRNNAYISHYTNGRWDTHTYASSSVQGGMYAITRDNITSLSPFTVADNNAMLTTGINQLTANNTDLIIYPNPSSNSLYFNTDDQPERIDIYDIAGNLRKTIMATNNGNTIPVSELPTGIYNLHFYGRDFQTVRKFIKQ